MPQDQSILYYTQAISTITRDQNYNKAHQFLTFGAQQTTTPCDFYRALAFTEALQQQTPNEDTLLNVYNNLDSYGAIEETVDNASALGVPEFPFARILDRKKTLLNYSFTASNIGRWCAAAAMVHIYRGNYEAAESVIQQGYRSARTRRGQHQILDTVSALNFMCAQRWGEVVDVTSNWLTETNWDPDKDQPQGEKTEENLSTSYITSALAGEAHAHLGEINTAKPLLKGVADASPFIGSQAHAHYVLGLIARHERNEEDASFHLGRATAVNPLHPDAKRVQDDPDATLYVTNRNTIDKRSDYWDFDTEPNAAAEREAERDKDRQRIIQKAMDKLDSFIGMSDVKKQVEQVKNAVTFQKLRAEKGLDTGSVTGINMIFQGPPGTGKTTVARCLGDIFYGLGVLSSPEVLEVGKSDLVGRYVGETPQKTKEKFNEARGGTFFLDEAYDLVGKSSGGNVDQFGEEALNTLLPLIYNHRGDTCTIFAGYEQDMERLMDVNEGLRSRFNYYIKFRSYTPEELGDIAVFAAKGRNMILGDEARQVIVDKMRTIQNTTHTNGKPLIDVMGNARCANNIVESSENFLQQRIMGSAGDTASLTAEDLQTIVRSDAEQACDEVISRFIKR